MKQQLLQPLLRQLPIPVENLMVGMMDLVDRLNTVMVDTEFKETIVMQATPMEALPRKLQSLRPISLKDIPTEELKSNIAMVDTGFHQISVMKAIIMVVLL